MAHKAPLSMGFSRQEYRSGVPRPPPGDLSDPGMKPVSPASPTLAARFFISSATWETLDYVDGPQVITRVLIRGREQEVRVRKGDMTKEAEVSVCVCVCVYERERERDRERDRDLEILCCWH